MITNLTFQSLIEARQVGKGSRAITDNDINKFRQYSTEVGKELPSPESALVPTSVGAAVSSIENHVQSLQRSLRFSIEDSTGRTIITVIDRETDEVIRTIPEEETLAIASRLKAATGVLISDEA